MGSQKCRIVGIINPIIFTRPRKLRRRRPAGTVLSGVGADEPVQGHVARDPVLVPHAGRPRQQARHVDRGVRAVLHLPLGETNAQRAQLTKTLAPSWPQKPKPTCVVTRVWTLRRSAAGSGGCATARRRSPTSCRRTKAATTGAEVGCWRRCVRTPRAAVTVFWTAQDAQRLF
jgi:hypothetical protein